MDTTHSLDDAFDKICRKTTLMIEQLVHPDGVHSSLLNVCLSQLGPQRNERMLLGKKNTRKKIATCKDNRETGGHMHSQVWSVHKSAADPHSVRGNKCPRCKFCNDSVITKQTTKPGLPFPFFPVSLCSRLGHWGPTETELLYRAKVKVMYRYVPRENVSGINITKGFPCHVQSHPPTGAEQPAFPTPDEILLLWWADLYTEANRTNHK